MMDDLQQAYSAYQQALYHLSDPKVCSQLIPSQPDRLTSSRSPSFGMALVSCTTATDPWSMPKKPSRKSCVWSRRSRKPTRSTSVSA